MKLWKMVVLAFLTLLCLAFLVSVAGPLPTEGQTWRQNLSSRFDK